jgi:hypothetical protein
VIGLAIPEDDATPHAPFVTITQGNLQTLHLDRADTTDPLGFGQLCGLFREEQLVTALMATSSEFLKLL